MSRAATPWWRAEVEGTGLGLVVSFAYWLAAGMGLGIFIGWGIWG